MRITKCDICKKTITYGSESVRVEVKAKSYDYFEICFKCGQPIVKILKKNKLLKNEKK